MSIMPITIDKEILGGTPVFSGTRVPIKNLYDALEHGATVDEFLQDFTGVSREQVLAILELSNKLVEASTELLHENTPG